MIFYRCTGLMTVDSFPMEAINESVGGVISLWTKASIPNPLLLRFLNHFQPASNAEGLYRRKIDQTANDE